MKIPRDKYLQELQSVMHNGMIKIITGVRRCGKSYLLFELFKQSLLDNGVNEDHVIQVDLENRRSKDLRNPDTLLDYIDGHIDSSKTSRSDNCSRRSDASFKASSSCPFNNSQGIRYISNVIFE